ncbi:TIM barrel protein [Hoyosella sp. YIM 151337]|uniref:TIM barrel protein n=1 Tax=Hoyosella sp. YIM 151337 TaxID=2992742 RepID=UPI002236193B|nr:TIM barrel protein [Hoyosella sp. YIM 151337]MCW4352408.1 TIM barrel protein [Hoyosella sp. YIM 151337]
MAFSPSTSPVAAAPRRPAADRVAGAPISWGVCEVPGWGFQLTPARVLGEMSSLGIAATEFGPADFLPEDPAARAEILRTYKLAAVGGFAPLVLHDPHHDPQPEVTRILDWFTAAGATVLVLAAATGTDGYDSRPELDTAGWTALLTNLDRLAEYAAGRGVLAVLHPHVGTMVETAAEVERVLSGSSISLCLDTGHLLIGGCDPVALTHTATDRIAHVHLKDVDQTLARQVHAGEISFTDGVRKGMFRPLGAGDIDIAGVITTLENHGFNGWYVLEQDMILDREPEDAGPLADARASVEFLHGVFAALQ